MKPYNFSFIDETIAGSGIPTLIDSIDFYLSRDIDYVISLTPQKPLVTKYQNQIKFVHYPVSSIPDNKTITDFLNLMREVRSNNNKAVVHCQYGQERTGLFLAIYLIEFKGLSPLDAIEKVRQKRPGSLMSSATINFLKRYKI